MGWGVFFKNSFFNYLFLFSEFRVAGALLKGFVVCDYSEFPVLKFEV